MNPSRGPSVPSRLAVVAILAGLLPFCIGLAGPELSGEWESLLNYSPTAGSWTSEIDLSATATFTNLDASARAVLDNETWTKLDLEAITALGAIDIESDLRFEPAKDRFKDWVTQIEWVSHGITFELTTKLTRTTDWLILELEKEWERIDLEAGFRFRAPSGVCSLSFYDVNLDLEFALCGIEADLELEIDDDGFDDGALELSDLVLVQISWATFDVEVEWATGNTEIDLSANLVLDDSRCGEDLIIELEGGFPNEPNLLPFEIHEISIEWSPEPWEIEMTAILDPDEWIDDLYWLEVESEVEPAFASCGELSLELAFLWSEEKLGGMEASLIYTPVEPISYGLDAEIDLIADRLIRVSFHLQIDW